MYLLVNAIIKRLSIIWLLRLVVIVLFVIGNDVVVDFGAIELVSGSIACEALQAIATICLVVACCSVFTSIGGTKRSTNGPRLISSYSE